MYKLIFACCLALALANEEPQQLDTSLSPAREDVYHIDDYTDMYRDHFNKVIQDCDDKLDHSHGLFVNSVDELNLISDFVTGSIVELQNQLKPLLVLNPISKNCINQYQNIIPDARDVQNEISNCIEEATNEDVYAAPLETRNDIHNYYINTFEPAIEDCKIHHDTEAFHYKCVSTAINAASAYTVKMQKEFKDRKEIADCSAKEKRKRSLDCSFLQQFRTGSKIAEAKFLIDKCRAGECQPCAYTCDAILQLNPHERYNEQVANPFYNSTDKHNCFMLAVGETTQYALEDESNNY